MASSESDTFDWDDAYANAAHIADADVWLERWPKEAEAFRLAMLDANRAQLNASYGNHSREVLDLFFPVEDPIGLAVIVHGGYWLRFDANTFSQLAQGALDRGWLVAMPTYPLCPQVRLDDITKSIGAAIRHCAAIINGPIRLAGHSAGGHLVTRQLCPDASLDPQVVSRIDRVLSISGVHDLRPLIRTAMNKDLKLDDIAEQESPALHVPHTNASVIAWVGADERPEFLRQNALLADAWGSIGVTTHTHVEPGRHHFDVIADLERADSAMLERWLGE